MTTIWKVLLGLALVVPMGAYVVGSLVGSSGSPVSEQTAVVVPAAQSSPTVVPGTEFQRRPAPVTPPRGDDDQNDADDGADGGGAGAGDPVDDNGVRVVTPRPQPVSPQGGGDDDDDDDEGDEGDDDGDDDDDGGDDD